MRRPTPPPITLPVLVLICLAAAACRDTADGLGRKTGNYEVIEEGSASGVTATIHSPGEVVTPQTQTAPMTGTSLDTTTAFTILDPAIGTAQPAPGSDTLGSTLPPVVIDSTTGRPVTSAPRAVQNTPGRVNPRPAATPANANPPSVTPRPTRPEPEPVPIEEPDNDEPAVEEPDTPTEPPPSDDNAEEEPSEPTPPGDSRIDS